MPAKDIRVLLVDDEEELVEYLAKRLLREGFTVRATTSGKDAVEVAAEEDFDVAVLDIKMPGMDGVETQRQLRELLPYLQTIILTGHGSIQTALETGRQDAFTYLQKPVDHDQLVQTITEAANRKNELQYEKFREEMEQITLSGGSSRSVIKAIEELRKKYGLS